MISASFAKRKVRSSKGSNSSTENVSPEPKRLAIMESPTNEGAIVNDHAQRSSDNFWMDQVLNKLEKLDVIAEEIKSINVSVNKINVDMDKLKKTVKEVKKDNEHFKKSTQQELKNINDSLSTLEDSNSHLNAAICKAEQKHKTILDTTRDIEQNLSEYVTKCEKQYEELKGNTSKLHSLEMEIHSLKEKHMNASTYNRRENLRFFGIPENEKEDVKEVLYNFLVNQAGIEEAESFEIQRVHRTGRSTGNKPRPIIARFLRFPDRETIFSKRFQLPRGFGISPDFPPEVVEIRKSLMPVFLDAKQKGKRASFSRREPHKLFIEGQEVKTTNDK